MLLAFCWWLFGQVVVFLADTKNLPLFRQYFHQFLLATAVRLPVHERKKKKDCFAVPVLVSIGCHFGTC